MPIRPVTETIQLPMETESDVAALLEVLRAIKTEPSESRRNDLHRDLGDHWAYLAGTRPKLFEPFREQLLLLPQEDLRHFSGSLGDLVVLLRGASDRATDHITTHARKEPDHFFWHWLLAAIGTEAALDSAATLAREFDQIDTYSKIGVWVPPTGPAIWRFTADRRAVFRRELEFEERLEDCRHPVGLELPGIVRQRKSLITWHYASVALSDVPGLPTWPAQRVHLVSPRVNWGYTLFCQAAEDGTCEPLDLVGDEIGRSLVPALEALRVLRFLPRSIAEFWLLLRHGASEDLLDDDELLREIESEDTGPAQLDLVPYDEHLVYCNGHIHLTDGVVGTAGGPPIGLDPPPVCPGCERLMFHVMSVEHHVRSYGDGFRGLFLCETCRLTACQATCWN